jgi:biopolymer transport protein ExbD
MAINVGVPDDDEAPLNSTINTTPLVDIMLVLLIIFLITIPVVITQIQVELPKVSNIPTQTKPENINLTVDANGQIYWGTSPITYEELKSRLEIEAIKKPQPEVHVRADRNATIGPIMGILIAVQKKSIFKVGFLTEPTAPTISVQ